MEVTRGLEMRSASVDNNIPEISLRDAFLVSSTRFHRYTIEVNRCASDFSCVLCLRLFAFVCVCVCRREGFVTSQICLRSFAVAVLRSVLGLEMWEWVGKKVTLDIDTVSCVSSRYSPSRIAQAVERIGVNHLSGMYMHSSGFGQRRTLWPRR